VRNFTSKLFKSVLASLPGKYFSTGGDEINTNCYAQDNETQAELHSQGKTFEEALDDFVINAHTAVKSMGKTPVVWEEMVLDHNVTLSNDTVVMWVCLFFLLFLRPHNPYSLFVLLPPITPN
jgi:hexosaminidase